jgi:hypothetical protein
MMRRFKGIAMQTAGQRVASLPTLLLLLVVLASAPTLAQAQQDRAAALDRIIADIKESREVASKSMDARVRQRLDLLLSRAELSARELQASLQSGAAPARPVAMPDADFTRFMTSLAANNFDDARLATLKTIGNARLSATQGKQILQKFSFDKGREEAAVFIHPRLVDPHLFAHVLEAMTFDNSRKAVMKRIAP